MDFKIVDMRLLPEGSKTKGFADIQFGDITVKDFRIMEDGEKLYVKVPFQTYKDRIGQLRFKPIIILPSKVQEEVEVGILSAFYRRQKAVKDGRSEF